MLLLLLFAPQAAEQDPDNSAYSKNLEVLRKYKADEASGEQVSVAV